MAPRYALEIMKSNLCDIMNNNLPFGGKIIILDGDFIIDNFFLLKNTVLEVELLISQSNLVQFRNIL